MKWWPWALGAVAVLALLVYGTLFSGWFRDDLPAYEDAGNVTLEATRVADGFDGPTLVTHAGGTLLVVEQAGRVHALEPDGGRRVWLDVTDRVGAGGERGLLGLALPPDHADSGAFYVHYTDRDGDTVLSRLRLEPGGAVADPDREEVLLRQDQPYPNHNGGAIVFGPDGYLYMGLGDGGLAADPHGNGQDPHTLLGAILRLDVSGNATEARPAPGNPFEHGGGDPRVWHYGLRNPWRFSFDADGNLWIGDVGQQHVEEVDFAPAGVGGLNFGWAVHEGSQRYRAGEAPGHVPPVAEYDHDGGHCSVTGGHVWEHDDAGPLRGHYLFGDYCSGTLWSHDPATGTTRVVADTGHRISSFGEDAAGRLYLVDHAGSVHRLKAR